MARGSVAEDECPPLRCPRCGGAYGAGERFCERCGLPLVLEAAEQPEQPDPRRERARKIKLQLAEGPLRYLVRASNQAEAELIQGVLLEEGVPSITRRSAGFDVPDFLAAEPRDLLVPESGLHVARETLSGAQMLPSPQPQATPAVAPLRLALGLLAMLALGALVIWLVLLAAR